MRKMTIGMLVIGLLLVCAQAFGEGEEAKTLTEWGLPADKPIGFLGWLSYRL
jgi:hypothetical protein